MCAAIPSGAPLAGSHYRSTKSLPCVSVSPSQSSSPPFISQGKSVSRPLSHYPLARSKQLAEAADPLGYQAQLRGALARGALLKQTRTAVNPVQGCRIRKDGDPALKGFHLPLASSAATLLAPPHASGPRCSIRAITIDNPSGLLSAHFAALAGSDTSQPSLDFCGLCKARIRHNC